MRPIGKPLSISIVNYLNTLPFRWALHRSGLLERIVLQEDIPSVCAEKLVAGSVDLALVPVAVLAGLETYYLHTDFCIGADGIVDSVKLYHDVPVGDIRKVLLDYQSRTSVNLARLLFRFHWQSEVQFEEATPGFEQKVRDDVAAVVIGDRTFALNGRFRFETDLAEAWKEFTGLPFVFAAWASTKPLESAVMEEFNSVLAHGVSHVDQAIAEEYTGPLSQQQVKEYLSRRIDYRFSEDKRRALLLFHEYLARL